MKIAALGERKLIERLEKLVNITRESQLSVKDDAVAMHISHGCEVAINTDMLVGFTDVPSSMAPFDVGRKAFIMNATDLVVKGVMPEGMVVSLGLPKDMDVADFDAILKGIDAEARALGVKYLGGDLNEARDLIISITMIGTVRAPLIPRHGIETGDIIFTTGRFGYTGCGLDIVLHKPGLMGVPTYSPLVESVLSPSVPLLTMHSIAIDGGIKASIDSSDGLAASLLELIELNEKGIVVTSLPVDPVIETFTRDARVELVDVMFHGGEEFHGLFVMSEESFSRLESTSRLKGWHLDKIGIVTEAQELRYIDEKRGIDEKIKRKGFEHFKARP